MAGPTGTIRELEHDLPQLRSVGQSRCLGAATRTRARRGRNAVATSTGLRRSIPRLPVCINTARTLPASKRGTSNYNKTSPEPTDHAIGRSRGGLTTKTHLRLRRQGQTARLRRHGRASGRTRLCCRRRWSRSGSPPRVVTFTAESAARRQGIPIEGEQSLAASTGREDDDPGTRRPDRPPSETSRPADRVRRGRLQGPQRRRAVLQPAQAVAGHRDALRQDRTELPRSTCLAATLLWAPGQTAT